MRTSVLSSLERWPLSYAQELLWFADVQWPGTVLGPRFTISRAEPLPGPLDLDALRRALRTVLDRQDALRSAVVTDDGTPYQVVAPLDEAPLSVVDRTPAELAHQQVPVDEPPVVRFDLVELGEDERLLAVTAHQFFFDFWSARLLEREIATVYDAFRSGRPSPLAPLPVQYVDYAVWQRRLFADGGDAAALAHWEQELRDLPATLLPTDRPRPAEPSGRGRRSALLLPAELVRRLESAAATEDATLNMLLLTIFGSLVGEAAGQADVVVPAWVTARTHPGVDGLVGNFNDIMLARLRADRGLSLRDALRAARATLLAAYEHQVPLVRIIETMPELLGLLALPESIWLVFDRQVFPLPPATTASRPAALAEPALLPDDEPDEFLAGADLEIRVREHPGGLLVQSVYSLDLFDDATIEGLLLRYGRALSRASQSLDAPLAALFA
jgi:hypothetical protein